jgi:hypothetical protein
MRTTPYKDVTRAVCVRCGDVASFQWEGPCALTSKRGKPRYVALCVACDAGLNRATLSFVYGPERAEAIMRGYE